MKVLSILLFLPLSVFGQPIQRDLASNDFDIEITLNAELQYEINTSEFKDLKRMVLKSRNKSVLFIHNDTEPMKSFDKNPPKHLNTYSLSKLNHTKAKSFAPQKRLDSLLALNDPEFPKENTLLLGLNPVRYYPNYDAGTKNMPEGFGPKIKI